MPWPSSALTSSSRGYARYLRAQGFTDETLRTYLGVLYRLVSVDGEWTERYVSTLGAQGPNRASTVQSLRSFYAWAVRCGKVPSNPAGHLNSKPPPPPPVRTFDEEEIGRLLVAAADRSERRAWAILLCYALGTRRSEVTGIRVEDITGRRSWSTARAGSAARSPWDGSLGWRSTNSCRERTGRFSRSSRRRSPCGSTKQRRTRASRSTVGGRTCSGARSPRTSTGTACRRRRSATCWGIRTSPRRSGTSSAPRRLAGERSS